MEQKQMSRQLRRDIGSYGWALVIYYILMNVCVLAAVFLDMVYRSVQMISQGNYTGMVEMDLDAVMGNGWGYLIACALALIFIRMWKGREFCKSLWKEEKPMTPLAFLGLTCVFISGQLVFQLGASFQEMILNSFGLSVLEAMELATGFSDTFSMFLYSCLAAPVIEEIVFRGVVLRGLERYGRGFALLISSVFFGLFHGNIIQSPYAFVVGLVLGYVTLEYHICWAMLMHMINNLVLGDMIPRLTQWMRESGTAAVTQTVVIAFAVVAAVVLIRKRQQIIDWFRRDGFRWDCWWAFCRAPGVIVMVILMELNAFSMLL